MKVIYAYHYTMDGKCFAIGYSRSRDLQTNGCFSEEVDPITHIPINKENNNKIMDVEFQSL